MEKLLPIILLFVLFFLNVPICFALFSSTFFYFIVVVDTRGLTVEQDTVLRRELRGSEVE